MTIFCKQSDLINESDVEQKLIYPFLTSPDPLGLGYTPSDFRTKPDLRHVSIGKGSSSKLYYPDYIIILHGLPLMIIEAKKPGVRLDHALKEARLYATEVNAQFPKNINPCKKIIATNGNELIAGSWDSDKAEIVVSFDNLYVENTAFKELTSFLSKDSLSIISKDIHKSIRGETVFTKPLRLLGGQTVQNEELEPNSFGTSFALEYRHIFNPSTVEERADIVKRAYVFSKRRLKHVDPIDKIIRAANPPSITHAQAIDTSKPEGIVEKLSRSQSNKHELLLLIGSVGSGKSTFIDFLREVGIPDDIKKTTVWVTIDLNIAPLSRDLIYTWLLKQVISSLKNSYLDVDFDDISIIRKVYSSELSKFEKGAGSLLDKNSERYNELLSNKIVECQQDLDVTIKAMIRFLCTVRNKYLIIVLDNCDKRNRDDQLLLFDVAKWIQKELKCLVFLPLRDTTFDHHRKEPPLDTVIKDLTFRIDPPPLMEVIYKRVKLALLKMENDESELLSYLLPNGMRVEYPRSELGLYMSCILRSLFQTDQFFRRLIAGVAGRDIRKGLEIFLDFCKSGHISSSEILKIRHSQGDYILPKRLIMSVLLRGNRRYYHDASSNIKNLFFSLPEDIIPDPYVRLALLQWLKNRYRMPGPNNNKGWHKVSYLISNITPLGHTSERIRDELLNLLKAGCIYTESQDPHNLNEDDLVTISPDGHVHLELLSNIDYLSACSEDIWYKDSSTSKRIADRMSNKIGSGHYTMESSLNNAYDLICYLISYQSSILSRPKAYLKDNQYDDIPNFNEIKEQIQFSMKRLTPNDTPDKVIEKYPPGSLVEVEVVSKQAYGIFVEFGIHGYGFVHISNCLDNEAGLTFEDIENGDAITAEIIEYTTKHNRFNMKLTTRTMS